MLIKEILERNRDTYEKYRSIGFTHLEALQSMIATLFPVIVVEVSNA